MDQCLFCRIVSGAIPAAVIRTDASTVAFLDVNPRAPGHTVVVPRAHAETILDLPEEAVGPLFLAVRAVAEDLRRSLTPDGFTIGINHGRAAGQAVDHLHVHVVPRWQTDGGGSLHSVVENSPTESLEALRERILAMSDAQPRTAG